MKSRTEEGLAVAAGFVLVLGLLAAIVCFGMFADSAYGETHSGMCGDNLTWTLDTSTGVLEITGSGPMYDYDESKYVPWYSCKDYIITVNIEYGMTHIGENAFSNCAHMTKITIPESVESISFNSFYRCSSLISITIPASVTDMGETIFSYCNSLASINVNPDNQNYASSNGILFSKDMSVLYRHPAGKSVTSYTIPDTVKKIEFGAFYQCESLEYINILNGVEEFDMGAFTLCSSLKTLTIPKTVTSIVGDGFYGCNSLKSIDVEQGNSKYTSVDGMLISCNQELISCPAGKTSVNYFSLGGVEEIRPYAFRDCRITSIKLPDSVKKIDMWSFEGCKSLTDVELSYSTRYVGVGAFDNCTSLKSIKVDHNSEYFESIDGVLFTKYGRTLVVYPAGKNVGGSYEIQGTVTAIENCAFSRCGLNSVIIPTSVLSVGVSAFSDCSNLETVSVLGGFQSYGDYVFSNCCNLKEINFSDGTIALGKYAFSNCINLGKITIPGSVTIIGENAFVDCVGLLDITVEEGVTGVDENAFPHHRFYLSDKTTKVYVDSSEFAGRRYVGITAGMMVETSIGYHHITYDINGGSGTAPTQADMEEGSVFTVAAYSGTKEGMYFDGWICNGVKYNPGDLFTMGPADVIFVAIWTETPVYEVSYNVNGGDLPAPPSLYLEEGKEFNLAYYNGEREGYKFKGWTDYTGQLYKPGDVYIMKNENVVFVAYWEKIVPPAPSDDDAAIYIMIGAVAVIIIILVLIIIYAVFVKNPSLALANLRKMKYINPRSRK